MTPAGGLLIKNMDLEREKLKLESLLKIPIHEVRYTNFFCEIYFQSENIGFLPVVMSADGIQYETSTVHLQKFDWSKLCYMNLIELSAAVASEVKKTSFKIIPTSFRRLFIEDADNNLFASFNCYYENQQWVLVDEKILSRD